MQLTDQQEQLSLAALFATCAKAGFAFTQSGRIEDNWGWDARVSVLEKILPDSIYTDFSLRFQLKSTRQALTHANGRYSFPLDVPHYNRLRRAGDSDTPIYLATYHLPPGPAEWCEASSERMVLRRCLRWVSLRGAPPTANTDSVTIYVPEENVLTPDALRMLASERSQNRWITYGDADAKLDPA